MGNRAASEMDDERIVAKEALDEILKFHHLRLVDIPEGVNGVEEELEYALRPHGIMRRRITLQKGWQHNAYGPILAFKKDSNEAVALLPRELIGYYYVDRLTGEKISIRSSNSDDFLPEAYCFYKPFPLRPLKVADIVRYVGNCIAAGDVALMFIATFFMVMTGMLGPKLVQILLGPVLREGNPGILINLGFFMVMVLLATLFIGASRDLILKRIAVKTKVSVEAAVMMRILSLRSDVFRKYSTGDLTIRAASISYFCDILLKDIMDVGIFALFSLLYLFQINNLAPSLLVPTLIIIFLLLVLDIVFSLVGMPVSAEKSARAAQVYGLGYSMVSGIRKIKLAGAEKRIFAGWTKSFARQAELEYNPPGILKAEGIINKAVLLTGSVLICYFAAESKMQQQDFVAFMFSYALLMTAVSRVGELIDSISRIPAVLELARPVLDAEPEISEGKEVLTGLSGSIELNNVYFRYQEDLPYVINDLSVRIRAGEYVAVVGMSGCGKSTLLRLLLGFEKPKKGAIYYDGRDMERIDLKSLRGRIGAVLQSGGVIKGDIYENISICAPGLSMEDAWKAADLAGLAEDIRALPMGMNTMISGDTGTFSGGQKQRLLIARALASKPSVLMFDEATSALDNKTQKKVSEAIGSLKCTRIVIAHRLSTIKECDRILVLEGGKIVEDGRYDELLQKGGYFSKLVERQQQN